MDVVCGEGLKVTIVFKMTAKFRFLKQISLFREKYVRIFFPLQRTGIFPSRELHKPTMFIFW
jgi:hypothetical protein